VGVVAVNPEKAQRSVSGFIEARGFHFIHFQHRFQTPASPESAKSPVEMTELFGAHFLYATESSRSGVLSRRHE